MSVNVGTIDRVIRAALGFSLLYLAFLSGVSLFAAPLFKFGAAVIGIVMLATSTLKLCPNYSILGLKSCGDC
ncbi:Protein of unknown function [Cribrihabitans marinus]|uniref:Inner membrane protein YgaP-like transmembrane domain-containing protein n=1 Tax=Cribrihabitans marinus TaxID=1227549 RepID=A0A1H6V2Z4_9RHOB|nr:DUF2892 domain-containing protein [Cribrihabitans marinus]GGH26826.1 hypothetical protein GCM10010973_14750 [Cribrihabitans marinus]SEI96217.1 Protein of unknown function [Cribrihabitans marinus]